MKSSVPKDATESLNIFEKFLVLVKLQAFSLNENYILLLAFFQCSDCGSRILSDLWSFVAVVDRWKSLSILAKAFIF